MNCQMNFSYFLPDTAIQTFRHYTLLYFTNRLRKIGWIKNTSLQATILY